VRSNCELEFRDVDATKVENGGRNLQVGVYENESLNLPSPARNNRLPPTLRQCQYGLYVPAPPRFRWIPTSYSARIAGRISIVGVYGLKDDAFPLWFSRLRNRHQHGTIHVSLFVRKCSRLPNGLIENILESLLRQSGTFEVSAMNKSPCNWGRTERH
jgi:hypothetical protein